MKVNYNISVGLVGCDLSDTIDIPDQELEGLDTAQREEFIDEWVRDVMANHVEWGWSEAE